MINILQIWYGPLDKRWLSALDSIKRMYPESKYTLITDGVADWPFEPDEIIDLKEHAGVVENITGRKDLPLRAQTNLGRWVYLESHPNTLYIDVDCYCIKKIPEGDNAGVSSYDYWAIYSGQSLDMITKAFDTRQPTCNVIPGCGVALFEDGAFDLREYIGHKGSVI